MWLILIVVILFVGFPTIFTTLMVSLHMPMLALLAGIVVRGTAFTFRHYDAVQEPKSQGVYTVLFSVSSLWTSVWFGDHRGEFEPRDHRPGGAGCVDGLCGTVVGSVSADGGGVCRVYFCVFGVRVSGR